MLATLWLASTIRECYSQGKEHDVPKDREMELGSEDGLCVRRRVSREGEGKPMNITTCEHFVDDILMCVAT